MFPSPFGVICSLIYNKETNRWSWWRVSVSFRSYLFSNYEKLEIMYFNDIKVSVSFRSYLFSNFYSVINISYILFFVSVSFRSYLFSNPHMRKGSFYKKFFGYFRVNFQNFYFFQFLNKKTC